MAEQASLQQDEREQAIRQLNALLRGEASAAQSYRMTLEELADTENQDLAANLCLLRGLEEEHDRAAELLRQRIASMGGQPSASAGVWGIWSQGVQGTANLLGDTAALRSLRQGEESGLKDYEEAAGEIDPPTARLIRERIIPKRQQNISLLDQLIDTVAEA